MKKSAWTPERDLFGMYLNARGVKKFTNKTGGVLLVAWDVVSGYEIGKLEFEDVVDYEAWMDAVVSDEASGRKIALFRCTQMILWPKA